MLRRHFPRDLVKFHQKSNKTKAKLQSHGFKSRVDVWGEKKHRNSQKNVRFWGSHEILDLKNIQNRLFLLFINVIKNYPFYVNPHDHKNVFISLAFSSWCHSLACYYYGC